MKDKTNEISVKNKIIYGKEIESPTIKGMGASIFLKMLEHKDVIAQIDAMTDEKDTNGEMLERAIRAAIKMRSKGIKRGDIVVTCTSSHRNSLIPTIASTFIGAIPTNLHPGLSVSDTVHLLNQIEAKIIFVASDAVALIEESLVEAQKDAEIIVFGQSDKYETFDTFLVPSPEEKDFVPVEIEDLKETAMIFFSSGSTGLPKGVCLSHRSMIGLREIESYYNMENMVVLSFTTPYWISATVLFLQCLYGKAIRVTYPAYDQSLVWDLLIKYKVNVLNMATFALTSWSIHGRPEGIQTPNLIFIVVCGMNISREAIINISQILKTPVINSYGLTECAGSGLGHSEENVEMILKNPHSIGRPSAGFAYKVVNLDTEEILGPNQPGELRIKTEFAMNGYHNLDASGEWDSDGFLKTGDIVSYDEDFNFFHVERIKEMIRYSVYQVVPARLEGILKQHPAVQHCVVVAIPHPTDGEHAVAIVTLNESQIGNVTPHDLEKFVEGRVDDSQRLRGGVKIVDSIPLTPSGKIARRKAKDLIRNI